MALAVRARTSEAQTDTVLLLPGFTCQLGLEDGVGTRCSRKKAETFQLESGRACQRAGCSARARQGCSSPMGSLSQRL